MPQFSLPIESVRDAVDGAAPERCGRVNNELWKALVTAADEVVQGKLDEVVFAHLYTFKDVAMYSVDGGRNVQLLMDVVCRGVMCEPGCHNGCGKCVGVDVIQPRNVQQMVAERKARSKGQGKGKASAQKGKGKVKEEQKGDQDEHLLDSIPNVWVKPLDAPVVISGWLPATTALGFTAVRLLLRKLGCPKLVSSVMVPPPLPENCVGVPRLLPKP